MPETRHQILIISGCDIQIVKGNYSNLLVGKIQSYKIYGKVILTLRVYDGNCKKNSAFLGIPSAHPSQKTLN